MRSSVLLSIFAAVGLSTAAAVANEEPAVVARQAGCSSEGRGYRHGEWISRYYPPVHGPRADQCQWLQCWEGEWHESNYICPKGQCHYVPNTLINDVCHA